MHWVVFAGFIYLSTAVLAAYFQVWVPTFALPLVGHFVLFEWVTDALLWLTLIGIVGLIGYRQAKHPRRLDRRSRFFGSTFWQAYFVEAIILGEAVAGLLIRGAEYQLSDAGVVHFPLTAWIGGLYGNASTQTLENIIVVLALVKILLAMVWLAVLARNITMGVAWHRFTAWFNIYFKRDPPGGTALGALEPLYVDRAAADHGDYRESRGGRLRKSRSRQGRRPHLEGAAATSPRAPNAADARASARPGRPASRSAQSFSSCRCASMPTPDCHCSHCRPEN